MKSSERQLNSCVDRLLEQVAFGSYSPKEVGAVTKRMIKSMPEMKELKARHFNRRIK